MMLSWQSKELTLDHVEQESEPAGNFWDEKQIKRASDAGRSAKRPWIDNTSTVDLNEKQVANQDFAVVYEGWRTIKTW